MKYLVLVEKHNDAYVARCPLLPHLCVADASVNTALARLHREFLCYVHDTSAELEILLDNQKQKTATSERFTAMPPLA